MLELAEDITTGLLREVKEETGLQIQAVALAGVYKNMTRDIVALVFRCKVVAGRLTETDETRAFRWVTADEVREMAFAAFAIRVLDAMQDDHAPAVRQHDGEHLPGA